MQIVLGPVDPSQSDRSCLGSSALDSRGTLIRPDSQPREMMGREAADSAHVSGTRRRAGMRGSGWGGADVGWDGKTGRQRVLIIAESRTIPLPGTAQTQSASSHNPLARAYE